MMCVNIIFLMRKKKEIIILFKTLLNLLTIKKFVAIFPRIFNVFDTFGAFLS
jgi:hypothetical protein